MQSLTVYLYLKLLYYCCKRKNCAFIADGLVYLTKNVVVIFLLPLDK